MTVKCVELVQREVLCPGCPGHLRYTACGQILRETDDVIWGDSVQWQVFLQECDGAHKTLECCPLEHVKGVKGALDLRMGIGRENWPSIQKEIMSRQEGLKR